MIIDLKQKEKRWKTPAKRQDDKRNVKAKFSSGEHGFQGESWSGHKVTQRQDLTDDSSMLAEFVIIRGVAGRRRRAGLMPAIWSLAMG